MSEKKGPFDAARRILSDYADYGVGTIGEVKGRSCEAAIRVLEAAGGVDKAGCVFWICGLGLDATNKRAAKAYNQIRALLESLPEKEEK